MKLSRLLKFEPDTQLMAALSSMTGLSGMKYAAHGMIDGPKVLALRGGRSQCLDGLD